MGAESIERQFESLHHGDSRSAESAQRKRRSGCLRDQPPDAAQSFNRCYAQTVLRLHKVIRGRDSIRSRYIDVGKGCLLSLNLGNFEFRLIVKDLDSLRLGLVEHPLSHKLITSVERNKSGGFSLSSRTYRSAIA